MFILEGITRAAVVSRPTWQVTLGARRLLWHLWKEEKPEQRPGLWAREDLQPNNWGWGEHRKMARQLSAPRQMPFSPSRCKRGIQPVLLIPSPPDLRRHTTPFLCGVWEGKMVASVLGGWVSAPFRASSSFALVIHSSESGGARSVGPQHKAAALAEGGWGDSWGDSWDAEGPEWGRGMGAGRRTSWAGQEGMA